MILGRGFWLFVNSKTVRAWKKPFKIKSLIGSIFKDSWISPFKTISSPSLAENSITDLDRKVFPMSVVISAEDELFISKLNARTKMLPKINENSLIKDVGVEHLPKRSGRLKSSNFCLGTKDMTVRVIGQWW